MPRSSNNLLLAFLAIATCAASGCARHLHTDRCGAILDKSLATIALDRLFISGKPGCHETFCDATYACDVGCGVEEEVVYCDEVGNCGLQVVNAPPHKRDTGPLVRYVPPQPPKFLTVPTQPAFTDVASDSPVPMRGSVERNFGPQFTFPGRD